MTCIWRNHNDVSLSEIQPHISKVYQTVRRMVAGIVLCWFGRHLVTRRFCSVFGDACNMNKGMCLSSADDKWTIDNLFNLFNWGWVTHACVTKLTIIGSDSGLVPSRHQAIICTNAGILLIGPLLTNFGKILIEIYNFHSRKCIWKFRMAAIFSRSQYVKAHKIVRCK